VIHDVLNDHERLHQRYRVPVVVDVALTVAEDVSALPAGRRGSMACSPASPGSASTMTKARLPLVTTASSPRSCSNQVSNCS
jgi:hypothetical protein